MEDSGFCRYHLQAKKNVESSYKQWTEGYGGMAWKEYLRRITKSSKTGQWAKEVAQLLAESAE